jgi:hypothetical protein
MSLPHYITNFNAHCADRVDVEADYNRSAPNTSYIWLQDYTSGHYVAETYGAIPGQHSADWVDERTDCKPINGNYRLLADFVTVGWTGAYAAASDTAGGNVENLTYWQYWRTVMTNDGTPNTSTLASPLLPGSDGKSFSDYWYNNGYNNGC